MSDKKFNFKFCVLLPIVLAVTIFLWAVPTSFYGIDALTVVQQRVIALFIFAALKEGMNAKDLMLKCVEKGAAYVPGTHFYAFGGHENTFRLNFSMSSLEEIARGMAILNEVFAG